MPHDHGAQSSSGIAVFAVAILFYGAALVIGGIMFIALLRIGIVDAIGILFYRGIAALILATIILAALLLAAARRAPQRWGLNARDAVSASVVAVSLLFAAFVLGPVTVDRSVSVFLLSRFERANGPLSADQARAIFVETYGGSWDQVGRRLREQQASGNLEQTPAGWQLTAQGKAFMSTARWLSRLIGGDPRFVGLAD